MQFCIGITDSSFCFYEKALCGSQEKRKKEEAAMETSRKKAGSGKRAALTCALSFGGGLGHDGSGICH